MASLLARVRWRFQAGALPPEECTAACNATSESVLAAPALEQLRGFDTRNTVAAAGAAGTLEPCSPLRSDKRTKRIMKQCHFEGAVGSCRVDGCAKFENGKKDQPVRGVGIPVVNLVTSKETAFWARNYPAFFRC